MLSRRTIFSLKKFVHASSIRAYSQQQDVAQASSIGNDSEIQKWKQTRDELEREQVKSQEKLNQAQIKSIGELADEIIQLNFLEKRGLSHYLEFKSKKDSQITKSMSQFQKVLQEEDIKKEKMERDTTKMEETPQLQIDLVQKLLNPAIMEKLVKALEMVSKGEATALTEKAKEASPVKEEKKEEAKQEKNAFNITLKAFKTENKIKVIKEVKTITGLGLKECKDKVEDIEKNPLSLGQNVPKDKATKIKQTLEDLGCTVEFS